MTDAQMGMHTHVLGMTNSVEVVLDEGMCNCNDKHYGLKAQIEGRLGVFI